VCITVPMANLDGLVLAAGAGTRMRMPKALMRASQGEPWLARSVELLRAAECSRVIVVLGARAAEAVPLVPSGDDVVVVIAERWADGMSASLRCGMDAAAAAPSPADAVLLTLVDLPDLPLSVAERVLAGGIPTSALRQATFGGRPGHPVLIGRDHWAPLTATLSGDRGARAYLAASGAEQIECADLSTGDDVDS
jgi:CTP:molybdopterin cytidylyltransferase MocA